MMHHTIVYTIILKSVINKLNQNFKHMTVIVYIKPCIVAKHTILLKSYYHEHGYRHHNTVYIIIEEGV